MQSICLIVSGREWTAINAQQLIRIYATPSAPQAVFKRQQLHWGSDLQNLIPDAENDT
jgi:hypothetical protein